MSLNSSVCVMRGAVFFLLQQAAFQASRQPFCTRHTRRFTGCFNRWKQKGGMHDIITCTSSHVRWLRARGYVIHCTSMASLSSSKPKRGCSWCHVQTCVFVQNVNGADEELPFTSGLGYTQAPPPLPVGKGGGEQIKGNLEVAE